MTIFEFHKESLKRYKDFVRSFVQIADPAIRAFVFEKVLGEQGELWPEPLIQLSPSYAPGRNVDELVHDGLLHPETARIFRRDDGEPLRLYRHQEEALKRALDKRNYVLTSGTGSGKSFTYFIPIIDYVVRNPELKGPMAIIVYPMNALVNSQLEALEKLRDQYEEREKKPFPVRFARYTGQTSEDERREIRANPHHIILTNYVMGEFLLLRPEDRPLLNPPLSDVPFFFVFDELHTYRGRQGADVAMLVRRMRSRIKDRPVIHVGTSATLVADEQAGPEERRRVVASFASRFFGDDVLEEDVIEETLKPATSGGPPSVEELRAGFAAPIPDQLNLFVRHPIVRFTEYALGIEEEAPGHYRRLRPRQVSEAAKELAKAVGVSVNQAEEKLREVLSRAVRFDDDGRPPFAFKLHQFISQTPPLYATLGHGDDREFATEFQTSSDSQLYPLAFCRSCGQEYYRVRLEKGTGKRFVPLLQGDDSKQESGYLTYVEGFDPASDLPDTWFDADGKVLASRKKRIPRLYYVAPDGRYVSDDERRAGVPAPENARPFYYQPYPFGLCLNCGADWTSARSSEFRKLSYLGSEGRTSSTTAIGLELLDTARNSDAGVRDKLLTFTDNRQDASLQAGHFNDFVRSALLRSALYQALEIKKGLDVHSLGQEVLKHSGLTLQDFAANPALSEGPNADRVRDLFAELIRFRLLTDLKRDWRFVQPSLEEVGLLEVHYRGADEPGFLEKLGKVLASYDINSDKAREVALALLDNLRKELAIHSEFLDRDYWQRLASRTASDLLDFWQIDTEVESAPSVSALLVGDKKPRKKQRYLRFTPNSRLGRYFRSLGVPKDAFGEFVQDLTETFVAYDLLRELAPGIYQIPQSILIWRLGNGKVRRDPLWHKGNRDPRVNQYFKALYQRNPKELAHLEAREHTAQVAPELREERERRFRGEGERPLPYLVSSPTLELGVDISTLDMVHLRNIPPTPANYAQRVGRAGRQGQPGLAFAFAGAFNQHDRYFFRRPWAMVSGAVRVPAIDLANESLLRSHIYAEWLASVGLPLHTSIADVINIEDPDLSFYPEVKEAIDRWYKDPRFQKELMDRIERMLANDYERLEKEGWFKREWIDKVIRGARLAFDRAFDDWRFLYRQARAQLDRANSMMAAGKDTVLSSALHSEASRQIRLLLQRDVSREEGDFYPYRYLASQEFLPGYNLMALPVRAWVPRGEGEYINRPRHLAITEFAPGAVFYHEGRKWVPARLLIPTSSGSDPTITKIACRACGGVNDQGNSNCAVCGQPLAGQNADIWHGIELVGVTMRRSQRITSSEEERIRGPFELSVGYSYSPGSVRSASADSLHLEYMPAARIHYFNRGRRDSDAPGFLIDLRTGEVYTQKKQEERKKRQGAGQRSSEEPDAVVSVGLHVSVTQNALRLQVAKLLVGLRGEELNRTLWSLGYALKRGMEKLFEVEEQELGVFVVGAGKSLSYLYVEQAEGGLGILRRLVEEPDALARVARAALEVLHFDPDTGDDLRPDRCKGACYECLLSYSNQSLFSYLDRYFARSPLEELTKLTVEPTLTVSVEQQLKKLEAASQSELERRFLRALAARNLPLPDEAQYRISEAHTVADFFYRRGRIAVYIDGPHHERERQVRIDDQQRKTLLELGYSPVVFKLSDVKALEDSLEGGDDPTPLKELIELLG